MITFLPFDSERDCAEQDIVQDVRVSLVEGILCIEQPDGAGEDYHFVAMPPHLVPRFVDALHAVLQGAGEITLSGLPPSDDD